MPHGESWLTLLLEHSLHFLTQPLGGVSWLGHTPIRYGHVLSLLLAFVILIGLGVSAKARVSDVKKAIIPGTDFDGATFVELFAGYVYDTMAGMMGRKAAKFFLPLIGACAFVIFISNAIGLVPGFTPATDNLNTTFAMGVVIFFVTHVYGVKENGLAYFKHFFGPVLVLAPLMFIIEVISHLSRPLTLGIRLMANMVADHAVLSIFLALAYGAFGLPFYFLGCLVVVVQTLVFCLLSTVYISMAIEHHEEGHH